MIAVVQDIFPNHAWDPSRFTAKPSMLLAPFYKPAKAKKKKKKA